MKSWCVVGEDTSSRFCRRAPHKTWFQPVSDASRHPLNDANSRRIRHFHAPGVELGPSGERKFAYGSDAEIESRDTEETARSTFLQDRT